MNWIVVTEESKVNILPEKAVSIVVHKNIDGKPDYLIRTPLFSMSTKIEPVMVSSYEEAIKIATKLCL